MRMVRKIALWLVKSLALRNAHVHLTMAVAVTMVTHPVRVIQVIIVVVHMIVMDIVRLNLKVGAILLVEVVVRDRHRMTTAQVVEDNLAAAVVVELLVVVEMVVEMAVVVELVQVVAVQPLLVLLLRLQLLLHQLLLLGNNF